VVVLFTGLEASTPVTVVSVDIQQCRRGKYLTNVERTETTCRLVTKQNFAMTAQNALLMLGHCTDVKVATAAPLQQKWRTSNHIAKKMT